MTVERYLTADELAEIMSVSVRTIRRMTAAGMPSETWGMGHTRRYLASQALAWAADRDKVSIVNPLERRANAARANQRRR